VSSEHIARLRAQRESWFELEPGKRLKIRRPAETEFGALVRGVGLEHVKSCVVGWDGFTEVDLYGSEVGASDEVPFDTDLWAEYIADRAKHAGAVSQKIAEVISQYLADRKEAQGN
jgi:hypothetical protein